ncbi:MAG: hypothetical protein ACK53L_14410, partial [Pirellulaceae bacterium]
MPKLSIKRTRLAKELGPQAMVGRDKPPLRKNQPIARPRTRAPIRQMRTDRQPRRPGNSREAISKAAIDTHRERLVKIGGNRNRKP